MEPKPDDNQPLLRGHGRQLITEVRRTHADVNETKVRADEILALLTPPDDDPSPLAEALLEIAKAQKSHTAAFRAILERLASIERHIAQLAKRPK